MYEQNKSNRDINNYGNVHDCDVNSIGSKHRPQHGDVWYGRITN